MSDSQVAKEVGSEVSSIISALLTEEPDGRIDIWDLHIVDPDDGSFAFAIRYRIDNTTPA